MRVRTSHATTKFTGLSTPSATGGTRQLLRLFPRQVFGFHLVRMQSLVKEVWSVLNRLRLKHLPFTCHYECLAVPKPSRSAVRLIC